MVLFAFKNIFSNCHKRKKTATKEKLFIRREYNLLYDTENNTYLMLIQFLFGFLLFFFVYGTHSYLTLCDRLFCSVNVDVCVLSFLHTFRSPSYFTLVIIGVERSLDNKAKNFYFEALMDVRRNTACMCNILSS